MDKMQGEAWFGLCQDIVCSHHPFSFSQYKKEGCVLCEPDETKKEEGTCLLWPVGCSEDEDPVCRLHLQTKRRTLHLHTHKAYTLEEAHNTTHT